MADVVGKLKALFGVAVSKRTTAFQGLSLSAKIRCILAKKLTESSSLPKSVLESLKDTKVFRIARLKDGRIKIYGKSPQGVERFLFSGGESPRLIKKTRINHLFATTEIHKGPIVGFKDTGYSVTHRIDRGMQPTNVEAFRTTRVAEFNKTSEWRDVTEHVNLAATQDTGNKFSVCQRRLDIVPVYNDNPSMMSKPISDFGEYAQIVCPLSLKEALASVKKHSIPELDKSKTAIVIKSASGLPVTIDAYKRQLWRI